MSRRVIRYEGEGRRRRPVYEDQGPGNGAAGTLTSLGPHAQVARISQAEASRLVEVGGKMPDGGAGKMPDGGAGKIERSMATEAQPARWRSAETRPSPIARVDVARPAMNSPEHLQQSRLRGARRHVEVVAAQHARAASPSTPPPEEPAMVEPAAPPEPAAVEGLLGDTLAILADAARSAQEAWDRHQAAEATWLAERAALEAAWLALWYQPGWMAPAELGPDEPPPDRLPMQSIELADGTPMQVHSDGAPETLAALRELGEAAMAHLQAERATAIEPPVPFPSGGHSQEIADDAPEVVTRRPESIAAAAHAHGGGSGARAKQSSGLTRRQEEVLAVVRRHHGDRAKAAAELKVRYQSVNTVLEAIGKAGKLPTELIAQLPASFARFTGV
jgi:hypothetical protein